MDSDDIARLRRVINRLSRQFNLAATDEGLTPAQASALGLIAGRGPISLAELTTIEGLNPTMLSRVVGRLVESGLVRRLQDLSDLRAGVVEVTLAGAASHQRIKEARGALVSEYLDDLSVAEQSAILNALPALEALAKGFSSGHAAERRA